ncbi:MAG: ribbon-helix-helix domain-containing protein, partial [Verrucomicrobiota bacterium]
CWNGSRQKKLNKTKTAKLLKQSRGVRPDQGSHHKMKIQNRIRAKSSASKVATQTKTPAGKTSSGDRVPVEVELPKALRDALERERKRSGLSRDEIFERAVRKELATAQVRYIKVLFPEPVVAALNLVTGNNPAKRAEFIHQAIRERLQRIGKGGAR